MSFAKIAEARAVKKIVAMLKAESKYRATFGPEEFSYGADIVLDQLIERIESGEWKDVKLPKPVKKAKKR